MDLVLEYPERIKMLPKKNRRTIATWVCLLSYLLLWIGSAHGISLIFLAAGPSHKVFLDESHHRTRLALHHPGVYDQHERQGTSPIMHRHDLLDQALAATSDGTIPEEDHIIQLCEQQEQAIAATKIICPINDASPISTVQMWPMIVNPSSIRTSLHAPPRFNSILVALRTTVLQI